MTRDTERLKSKLVILVGRMLDYAILGEEKIFSTINPEFDLLLSSIYPGGLDNYDSEKIRLDNIRQSCIFSLNGFGDRSRNLCYAFREYAKFLELV